MKKLAQAAVEHLRKSGVQYADARVVTMRSEKISVKNQRVEAITDTADHGIGIRVLSRGAWGFAGTDDPTEQGVMDCAERALGIARASGLTITERASLADRPAEQGVWESPRLIDPFTVPLEEKIALFNEACAAMAAHADIGTTKGHVHFVREQKAFVDTEGADLEQDILHTGAGIEAIAQRDGQVQRVSYPNSHGGDWAAAGWEWVERLRLVANAAPTAELAARLLDAPECPTGEYDLILAGPQLALQIHESCGHPTEHDRALGTEISLAGGSFMTPDRLGKLQYGSKHVNLYGDSTIAGALGSFGWDDEGVASGRFDLVTEGRFVGYQTSRETARLLGQASNGSMRASGWSRLPLIRMTNINLAPGPADLTLEDLIADTKRGLLMDINKSWSIDDLRLNFSFGCEYAWLIENGRRTTLVKNPVYVGITPQFWGSCDAVAGSGDWRVWGVPNCGKGQPMQIARVAHGCSAARFIGVTVGRKS
jgi:TldD protein